MRHFEKLSERMTREKVTKLPAVKLVVKFFIVSFSSAFVVFSAIT